MKTIKDFLVSGKRVLVRCDFNVPLEDGVVQNDFRIKKTLPTIQYLIENKAKVILATHVGDPKGKFDKSLTIDPIFEHLAKIIKIEKASDCIGQDVIEKTNQIEPGTCLLLENLRFHPGEQENNREFSEELSKVADIYINEAFSCSHRLHSSIVGITEFLPSGAGFLLEKEIKVLSKAIEDPIKPLVCVVGGVKIETRIKLIKNLLEKSDNLILGGELANTILRVNGIYVGNLPDEKIIKEVKGINFSSKKVHLPVDVLASPDKTGKVYIRKSSIGKARKEEMLLDIGPESIKLFSEIIKKAKTIIFAGPLGFFENPLFEKGTKEVGEAIIKNHTAYKIVGGGDTLFAINKFNLEKGFDHISTGGGAMLTFLSGEELPGIIALK